MQTIMQINQETAMRLWTKSFGKAKEAFDFAGRKMLKAAYGQTGSQYGWNLDHIYPESKGGKTTDSNLICCHIATNSEKADKLSFRANGKPFQIVKVENHYEIKPFVKKDTNSPAGNAHAIQSDQTGGINFYDSAAGIRLFKGLKGIQNRAAYLDTIVIKIRFSSNASEADKKALFEFIREVFSDGNVSFERGNSSRCVNLNSYSLINFVQRANNSIGNKITINYYNLSEESDAQELLNRCVLMNTYFLYYFKQLGIVSEYSIFYGAYVDDDKLSLYSTKYDCERVSFNNTLWINENVRKYTGAYEQDDVVLISSDRERVYRYNYINTRLRENLSKAINK